MPMLRDERLELREVPIDGRNTEGLERFQRGHGLAHVLAELGDGGPVACLESQRERRRPSKAPLNLVQVAHRLSPLWKQRAKVRVELKARDERECGGAQQERKDDERDRRATLKEAKAR